MRKHSHSSGQPAPTFLFSAGLLCAALFSVHGYNSGQRHSHLEEVLNKVIMSVDGMVGFFSKDFSSVNVDGLFGVRVGQGSINQSVADCSSPHFQCPQELVNRLMELNRQIEHIAQSAVPYVKAQDEDYFQHFSPTLDGPYILQYRTDVIKDPPVAPSGDRKYNEEKGDECISNLMGRYENNPTCTITDECIRMMTHGDTAGYVITHQLLYFIVGDKTGCVPALTRRLKDMGERSLRSHEAKLCARILGEATEEAKDGNVKLLSQDLFLEQSLLCGILGFQNFMTEDWVDMVLSWQGGEGCFPLAPSLLEVENQILRLQGEQRRLLSLMKKEAENIDHSPVPGRKLLREKLMEGDCLAHKTGLGFGLVSAYIRHYVRLLYGSTQLQ